jgi:20S proteasome subunit beta 7
MAMFTDLRRLRVVGDGVLLGASGEYSDFQAIVDMMNDLVCVSARTGTRALACACPPVLARARARASRSREDKTVDDGRSLTAPEAHAYLTRVMYNRRNKMDPLWNALLVAGVGRDGTPSLGTVDRLGTAFSDNFLAVGFGHHFAMPLLREAWRADLTEEAARALLEGAMRVCFYRDCRALNRFVLAKVTAAGGRVSEPYSLETKWDFKSFVDPKAGAEFGGSW